MRIGIEINGVLRDTLKKIQEVYQKWYIDNPFLENEDFERKVISDVTSLDIMSHLSFRDADELYNFLYKEYTMEIFGHAGSVEMNSMILLNDFYLDMRDNHDIWVVSDEMSKSKPASLFFLSKFGCLVENVKFYSEVSLNLMWEQVGVLITADPNLLQDYPDGKTLIKFKTSYNSEIHVKHEITSIKELKAKIESL